MRAILALIAITLLSGCAATVNKHGPTNQLTIAADAKQNLVVNFTGNSKVESNARWGALKTSWRNALQSEASTAGYALKEQAGTPRLGSEPGTILLVDVSNFRYLTPAMRYSLGIMVGNAWVDADVSFLDLQTGQTIGVRKYNTSSTAWEGVFSAMTDEQLQALAKEMISEVRSAKAVAPSVVVTPVASTGTDTTQASKDQQIQQLMQQNLPYEEYQARYRQIMAE
jgi:uncharacterized protein YceK